MDCKVCRAPGICICEPAPPAALAGDARAVPLDVLRGLYSALLVLRTMTKKAGLDAGEKKAAEMLGWLEEIEPALPALSALRAAPKGGDDV